MRDLSSSKRGITPHDLCWPQTPEFTHVVSRYSVDAVDRMLDTVWKGYKNLANNFLSVIDFTQADEELERSVTQMLEPSIRKYLTGDESYDIQHGSYEYATRSPAPAQPPEYDIAFFLKSNLRIMWPLEAKVMRTPANVAKYISDIKNEYLTGRYAPFSRSAAMVGYLISGKPAEAPAHIEKSLGEKLTPHKLFYPDNPHYISNHTRVLSNPSWVSGTFQCHHMIMALSLGY